MYHSSSKVRSPSPSLSKSAEENQLVSNRQHRKAVKAVRFYETADTRKTNHTKVLRSHSHLDHTTRVHSRNHTKGRPSKDTGRTIPNKSTKAYTHLDHPTGFCINKHTKERPIKQTEHTNLQKSKRARAHLDHPTRVHPKNCTKERPSRRSERSNPQNLSMRQAAFAKNLGFRLPKKQEAHNDHRERGRCPKYGFSRRFCTNHHERHPPRHCKHHYDLGRPVDRYPILRKFIPFLPRPPARNFQPRDHAVGISNRPGTHRCTENCRDFSRWHQSRRDRQFRWIVATNKNQSEIPNILLSEPVMLLPVKMLKSQLKATDIGKNFNSPNITI